MLGRKRRPQSAILVLALLLMASRVQGDNKQEIDDFIAGLDYDRDRVLAYHGELETAPPRQGHLDDNRQDRPLSGRKTDIGIITSSEHIAYPGNLLLANGRLLDNTPDVLAIDRAPLTYTVDLPGLTTDGSFTITPSYSAYQASRNKVLETWFQNYSMDHQVMAKYQSISSFAQSKVELRVKFGMEFKFSAIEADIDFDAMRKQEKLIMIHKFSQVYYTVSVEPPQKTSDLFAANVTIKDVQQKTNKENPPVMVDSVSYGRTIYVKIETSSTDQEAKIILESRIKTFDISGQAAVEYTNKLENLAFTVYVLGGSYGHIQLIKASTFQEVNNYIINYSKLSKSNLGHPISYSALFIKDNSRATVNSYT